MKFFLLILLFVATSAFAKSAIPYQELVGRWSVIEWVKTGEQIRPHVSHLREVIVYLPFFSGPPLKGESVDEHMISAIFLIEEAKWTEAKLKMLENSQGVLINGGTIRLGPKGFGHEFIYSITPIKGVDYLELRDGANRFLLKKDGPAPKPEGQGLIYPTFNATEINELWEMWRQWWKDHPLKGKKGTGSKPEIKGGAIDSGVIRLNRKGRGK